MTTHHTTRVPAVTHRAVKLDIRTSDLPEGICGRVQGIALTYNIADAYGTMFAPGCLDRTKAEKLAAGKVKLLADHEGVTNCHVGVVRTLETVGDSEVMSADVFDTLAGRAALEYVKAVVAAKAFTGLSIGFYDRESEWVPSSTPVETAWGSTRDSVLVYTECELDEISLTPSPAVPGAEVTGTRRTSDKREILRKAFGTLVDALPDAEVRELFTARFGVHDTNENPERTAAAAAAANGSQPEEKDAPLTDTPAVATSAAADASAEDTAPEATAVPIATMDERMRAVRQSYRI